MATASFDGVKITGIACAVPKHTDSINNFINDFGKDNVDKFISTTGVYERRRVNEKQTNSDLCYVAAEKIIQHKKYNKDSFDGIVLVTQSPDYARPATSHILHKRLGLNNNCMAFDINLGCSGFVYAVNVVASMIKAGALKRVLLCCGESDICLEPKDDKAISMLFGDAGAAIIVEQGDGCINTLLKADGEGYKAIIAPGFNPRVKIDVNNFDFDKAKVLMDGSAVFEFAIIQVPRAFKEFFRTFEKSITEYDYCILHQANLFMLNHICKKIKLAPEKMPISIDRYGNTSSASIPLTIADAFHKDESTGVKNIIASGFGVGLSWGVVDFRINSEDVLPVIETEDYFEEAYIG